MNDFMEDTNNLNPEVLDLKSKLSLYGNFMLLMVILVGCYSILHNQITYSISNEYFTKFKFRQFDIPGDMPPRLGASMVGLLSTRWLGFLLGIVPYLSFHCQRSQKRMTGDLNRFMIIVFFLSIIGALCGYILGSITISRLGDSLGSSYWFPDEIEYIPRFFLVGRIHLGSYIGVAVGFLLGLVSQVQSLVIESESNKLNLKWNIPLGTVVLIGAGVNVMFLNNTLLILLYMPHSYAQELVWGAMFGLIWQVSVITVINAFIEISREGLILWGGMSIALWVLLFCPIML